MAGVTTGDLKTFQLQTKLNLNTNVILDLVQMVSVTQTGCHVSPFYNGLIYFNSETLTNSNLN